MEFGATYPYEGPSPHELTKDRGAAALAGYKGSFGTDLDGLAVEAQLEALPSHGRRPGAEFPHWKQLFIRQNRDFYEANREWIDPWLPKLANFPSSFQKFEWNAQGEERTIWKSVIQLRASGVRVKRPTTAPSLIAMTDTQVPIIAWERRYMTPEECGRLQSLESIKLPEQSGRAFRALGNAVNARVVEEILAQLIRVPGISDDSSVVGQSEQMELLAS
jgi:DNA (cytosine-5)-methyltransferase 1